MLNKKRLLGTAVILSILSMGVGVASAAEYTETILNTSKDFQNGDIVNVKYYNGNPDGTAVKVDNGKEVNVNVNGAMTLQGMPLIDGNSAVVVAKGSNSTLNLTGDFTINNVRAANEYTTWGSFGILSQKGSTINITGNVDILGQNCGLSVSGTTDTAINIRQNAEKNNKLQINLEVEPDKEAAKEMYGVYGSGTLNVDTDASITLTGNSKKPSGILTGIKFIHANGVRSDINFNGNTKLDISNSSSATGIELQLSNLSTSPADNFTTAHFGDNTEISLHDNRAANTGISVADKVKADFNNVVINIDGGMGNSNSVDWPCDNVGIITQGAENVTIKGTTNILVQNNAKQNHGLYLTQSQFKGHAASNVTMADANITAVGGTSATGIEVVNSNFTGTDGHTLTIAAHGGSDNNYGIAVRNGHVAADTVNINVAGRAAVGLDIGNNNKNQEQDNTDNTTAIKNLTITANGNGANSKTIGIKAAGNGNKLTLGNVNITAVSQDNTAGTYGIKADTDSTITVNNACTIDAKNALEAGKNVYGKVAGNLELKQDFISKHQDAVITSMDSAVLGINTSGKGTVQFSGTSKIMNYSATDDSIINMNLTNSDSYWHVTGNSSITDLQNSNSLVDMSYDNHQFSTLNIKNLSGNGGTINMDIDASTNTANSDKIYITGTHSGENYITLNNVGTNVDGAEGTVLVSVNDEQGKFLAKDGEGALYWKKYTLDQKESTTEGFKTDWYVKEEVNIPEKPEPNPDEHQYGKTTSVETILAANALGYQSWRNSDAKLLQRLGDLRHNGEAEQGAWFRVNGAKLEQSGAYQNDYTTYHLGYDFTNKRTVDKVQYQGLALSYTDGDSTYKRGGGSSQSKELSLYSTDLYNSGHYLDLVLKVSDMDNDFSVYDTQRQHITGDFDNRGISLSAEYGRKNALHNGWYIEPQAQFTLGYYGSADYTTSNGISVAQSGITSAVGRIGFNIGKEIGDKGIVYLKANLLHEFGGSYDVDMRAGKDVLHTSADFRDTWFEYGLGMAMATGRNNHVYLDVERTTGSDCEEKWQWNAGMRWTF